MKLIETDTPPEAGAIHQGGRLYLVSDDAATALSSDVVADKDIEKKVPVRDDLPPDSPHFGKRLLRHVISGQTLVGPDQLKSTAGSVSDDP